MAKVTMVDLFNKELGIRAFEITHAERILNYPNSGWDLTKDSKYTYSKEDGIRLRADKRTIKE